MATIKSHTDLEQSKVLADILPIESADYYHATGAGIVITTSYITYFGEERCIPAYDGAVPCWSLAALVDILPRSIEFKDDKYYLRFMKDYVEYANDEVSITGRFLHTTGNNNLVDACYEMIIKLHEFKML